MSFLAYCMEKDNTIFDKKLALKQYNNYQKLLFLFFSKNGNIKKAISNPNPSPSVA